MPSFSPFRLPYFLLTLAFSTGVAWAQAPANDNFAAAAPLAAETIVAGTTAEATAEANEPATHVQNAVGAASVWYQFTPTVSGLYQAKITGTPAPFIAIYTGSGLNTLTRHAGGREFFARAGEIYHIQIAGPTAASQSAFSLTLALNSTKNTVVVPFHADWEYLVPTGALDPTASTDWAANWRVPGDATLFVPAGLQFNAPSAAPFGYGGLDSSPGMVTTISPAPASGQRHAAFFRRSFTLTSETSNLWAEILADDGAYIYIDDFPPIPVLIAARISQSTAGNNATNSFTDHFAQSPAFLTGNVTTPCRAVLPAMQPTGFSPEANTTHIFLSGLIGKLGQAGTSTSHRIAVSVHQSSNTSSDMGFDLQLVDRSPRPLPVGGLSTSFTSVPHTPAVSQANPFVTHHWAPWDGSPELAWAFRPNLTRGSVTLRNAHVANATTDNTLPTGEKSLRLQRADGRFETEPLDVSALPYIAASIRLRTRNTSTGSTFEPVDHLRIFLETSADGVNFAEPVPPAELLPETAGDVLLYGHVNGPVTKSAAVLNPTGTTKAVRMVVEGGTDSDTETIYLDDVQFSTCQLIPTITNVVYLNGNDDVRANDQLQFTLNVAELGATGTQWDTLGMPNGSEVVGNFGATTVITVPVPIPSTTPLTFLIRDAGNPTCTVTVSLPYPQCSLGQITLSPAVRLLGPTASLMDDSFTCTATITAPTATGVGFTVHRGDTLATLSEGLYGTPLALVVPVDSTMLVFRDKADTACQTSLPLDFSATQRAMGLLRTIDQETAIYATPANVTFRQAALYPTNYTADFPSQISQTSLMLSLGNAPSPPLLSDPITLLSQPGTEGYTFAARLRAWENSTTGFEYAEATLADTFQLELVITTPAGEETRRINPPGADKDGNGVLNGYTGITSQPYNTHKTKDEFNQILADASGRSRGTFFLRTQLPLDATQVLVRVTAINDSANEHFFLEDLLLTTETMDIDMDGMPDLFEQQHGLNLAVGNDAATDADGDGMSNLAEYIAGTSPQDITMRLRIIAFDPAPADKWQIQWSSVPSKNYAIQTSDDLLTWQNLLTTPAASLLSYTTATFPQAQGQRFFRVQVAPP